MLWPEQAAAMIVRRPRESRKARHSPSLAALGMGTAKGSSPEAARIIDKARKKAVNAIAAANKRQRDKEWRIMLWRRTHPPDDQKPPYEALDKAARYKHSTGTYTVPRDRVALRVRNARATRMQRAMAVGVTAQESLLQLYNSNADVTGGCDETAAAALKALRRAEREIRGVPNVTKYDVEAAIHAACTGYVASAIRNAWIPLTLEVMEEFHVPVDHKANTLTRVMPTPAEVEDMAIKCRSKQSAADAISEIAAARAAEAPCARESDEEEDYDSEDSMERRRAAGHLVSGPVLCADGTLREVKAPAAIAALEATLRRPEVRQLPTEVEGAYKTKVARVVPGSTVEEAWRRLAPIQTSHGHLVYKQFKGEVESAAAAVLAENARKVAAHNAAVAEQLMREEAEAAERVAVREFVRSRRPKRGRDLDEMTKLVDGAEADALWRLEKQDIEEEEEPIPPPPPLPPS